MLVGTERSFTVKFRWIRYIIIGLLVAYPALTLIVPGAVNIAIFLLFLFSLIFWARERWSGRLRSAITSSANDLSHRFEPLEQRFAILYILSMAGLPAAVFISQWANHRWEWNYYDAVSRFLISAPIFFMLRKLEPSALLKIRFGFIIGALAAVSSALFIPHVWGSDQGLARIGTSFVNPIHFGDIALTLGIIPLFGLDWRRRTITDVFWTERLIALFAAICGIYASVLSGSRGGWAAIPVFLILAYLTQRKALRITTALKLVAVFVAISLLTYYSIQEIRQRIDLIYSNLHAFDHGNENTSIGIRLQLWKAALIIFFEHPLFGVGMGGFKALMTPMEQAGQLSALAADFGRQEVHSEILSRLSQLGLIGLVAILAVYLVPGWMFWRRLSTSSREARLAAHMGLAFVLGFFIYGLTVETFDLTMTAAFYALTIAVLLAASYPSIQNRGTQ